MLRKKYLHINNYDMSPIIYLYFLEKMSSQATQEWDAEFFGDMCREGTQHFDEAEPESLSSTREVDKIIVLFQDLRELIVSKETSKEMKKGYHDAIQVIKISIETELLFHC